MTAVVDAGSVVGPGTSRTLEEQLRRVYGQLCLAADLFDVQAVAPDAGWPDGLSPAACAALSGVYRQAGQELAATLNALPTTVLNRALETSQDSSEVEGAAGSAEHPAPPHTRDDPEGADR